MFKRCKITGDNVWPDDHHAKAVKRGQASYPMSPSELKTFDWCPSRWLNGWKPDETDAKSFGNLVDSLVLQPDTHAQRYIATPENYPAPANHAKVKSEKIKAGDPLPWNSNAQVCSEWEVAQEAAGLEVVSMEDMNAAIACRDSIFADPILESLLNQMAKQVQVVGEWECQNTGIVVPVRCLIDLAPAEVSTWSNYLADLKTCRSAHPYVFKKDFRRMGYHVQAAFDLDMWNAATGQELTDWCFVLVENTHPFTIGREILSQAALAEGKNKYESALTKYAQCLKTGKWPGYDDHPRALNGWTIARLPDEPDPSWQQETEVVNEESEEIIP